MVYDVLELFDLKLKNLKQNLVKIQTCDAPNTFNIKLCMMKWCMMCLNSLTQSKQNLVKIEKKVLFIIA